MVRNKRISIVIPCRNEEKIIGQLIREIPDEVDEVIVVDNNSRDKTAQVAKGAGAVVFKEKRAVNGIGYGFAHQTGLKYASGDYLVGLDGDRTYPASEIPKIVKFMERSGIDFISCNRLPLKNKKAISKIRQLGIKILNSEVFFLYGYPIKDILTGMWVFKKDALEKLNLKEGGWDLSPEIKLAAIYHPEIKFAEYHIPHFVRDGNLSKQVIWKTGFGHFWYILKRRLTIDGFLYPFLVSVGKNLSWRLAQAR